MRFEAAIHGIDLDNPSSDQGQGGTCRSCRPSGSVGGNRESQRFMFLDPAEIDKMTPEERESSTKSQMQYWRSWAGSTPLGD